MKPIFNFFSLFVALMLAATEPCQAGLSFGNNNAKQIDLNHLFSGCSSLLSASNPELVKNLWMEASRDEFKEFREMRAKFEADLKVQLLEMVKDSGSRNEVIDRAKRMLWEQLDKIYPASHILPENAA